MSWITDYFAEGEKRDAEALERAEREAIASGKEPFDLAKLEKLLNRGPQTAREKQHRENYYIMRTELRTLAEYAAHLREIEPWEDAR